MGNSEKENNKFKDIFETFVVYILIGITSLYDFITLLVYALIQRPWVRIRKSQEKRAVIVNRKGGLTFESVKPKSALEHELCDKKIDTLEKVFLYATEKNGENPCLGTREVLSEEDELQKDGKVFKKYILGDYKWKSYIEVNQLADSFSFGLLELGLKPKDKIVIFAETREEWLIAAMAAFKQNIKVVTLYATLGDEALIHGLNETEAEVVITSHDLLPKFKNILNKTPKVRHMIYMKDPLQKTNYEGMKPDVNFSKFSQIITMGGNKKNIFHPPSSSDVAIMMYTSGTTGVPKGVLITHRNVCSAMMSFSGYFDKQGNDSFLAFLPLAHILELMCESICFLSGIPIAYSSPNTLADNSSKVKKGCKGDATVLSPTFIATVPLILDRIYKGIQQKIEERGTKKLFDFFYNYKLQWYKRGYETPIVDKFIFRNIKRLLGGRVRLMVCGGAPLSPDTHEFIRTAMCCPILQGYGLTETAACACVTDKEDMGTGSVGGPVGCSQIKIVNWDEGKYQVSDEPNPRGELLIGGHNVSIGYYKLPKATQEDFFEEDGKTWFKSGDIAEVFPDGSFRIIDRKKDLVKLQFGEYVSLGKVEAEMKTCPLVQNICVYGDSKKQSTVALLMPNMKKVEKIAEKLGKQTTNLAKMYNDGEVEKEVLKEIQNHGKKCKLEKYEIPAAVKLVHEIWTPDSGLVTAAYKLKRKNIQEHYQKDINRMYGGK